MAYSLKEAKSVMAATQKILNADARRQPDPRKPRAAAATDPPAAKYSFADEIVKHQEDGATLPEATRLAAQSRPDLHKKFVKEENKKREREAAEEKENARRVRSRNDRC